MSKRRTFLVTALIVLIIATAALFIFSVSKENPAPEQAADQNGQPSMILEETIEAPIALDPLPADDKDAVKSEIADIEAEIESMVETELDDLSDIEFGL